MSLISTEEPTSNGSSTTASPAVQQLALSQILRSPFNRDINTKSDEFKDFVDSIRAHGIIQPLVARPLPAALDITARDKGLPCYELVAGERRWLGGSAAGLKTIPVMVRQLTDRQVIELQTIENDQRSDLNAIEQAEKYQQLLDQYVKDGMTQEKAMAELCAKLSKGKSTVYEALRLLKLPAEAREAVQVGKMPPSHAGLIAKLEDAPEVQAKLTQKILAAPTTKEQENAEWNRNMSRDASGILSFRDTKELVDEQTELSAARKKFEAAAAKHKGKGGTVLSETDLDKCIGAHGNIKGGYVSGDEGASDYSKGWPAKTYKALMGKHAPKPVLAHDQDYRVLELYPKKGAIAAIEKNGHKKRVRGAGSGGYDAGAAAREQTARQERTSRMLPVLAAADKQIMAASKKSSIKFPWAFVVDEMIDNVGEDEIKRILETHGWKKKGSGYRAAAETVVAQVSQLPANRIPELLLEILVGHRGSWDEYRGKVSDDYVALCKHYGVDLVKLTKELAPAPEKKAKVQTPGKLAAGHTVKKPKGLTASTRRKLSTLMKARWAAQSEGKAAHK